MARPLQSKSIELTGDISSERKGFNSVEFSEKISQLPQLFGPKRVRSLFD